MTYSFSSTPVYVSEGDYVQFRFKAPPTWDTTQTVTIQLGDLVQYWLITTVPEDFTPDPFPFQNVEDADLDVLYTYGDGSRPGESIITVTGLTPTTQAAVSLGSTFAGDITYYAMRIDYNGDGNWGRLDESNNPIPEYGIAADDYWIQGSGGEVVQNGSRIQIRGRTQNFNQQNTIITLVIGTANETWRITTKAQPLNIPEPFPNFTDLTNLDLEEIAYSEVIRIQGLTEPAAISLDNGGEWAVSSTNSTTTNGDGYEILDGVTFSSTPGTVNNGDYLQLKLQALNVPLTPNVTNLTIGDGTNLSNWSVETGNPPSTGVNGWSFTDLVDVIEDSLIASNKMPPGGITGLGPGVSVPVTVIGATTTATETKIKINNGSIGVFPVNVSNGDQITIYAKSDPNFSQPRTMQIQVGDTTIPTWTIITSSGPDYDADFTPPSDKVNQVPSTYITSSPVTVTGINRPITITASNGALISIDFDTPVVGPRIFDPAVNSSFSLTVLSADQLGTPEFTNVVVGTEAANVGAVSFTWTVSTYAVAPPPAANLGTWYSKKVNKFDGYSVGTICAILKENVIVGYGDLDGDLNSRYPGFVQCDGRALDASEFRELYEVIGTEYGGSVTETFGAYGELIYNGTFNVPDYRNRKLAGTGFVDSSRGNSAFLPVSTPGKGIFDVGAEGGYWYFDTVDAAGSLPLEQIEGSGQTGLQSQFFSLGTVRLEGLETITDSITFTITGSVTGLVGPLGEVSVRVPSHEHLYLTAVVENDGGDPLIPFNTSSGTSPRGMLGLAESGSDSPAAEVPWSQDAVVALWANFLNTTSGGRFAEEIERYYDADSWTDLNTWIVDNLPTSQTADSGAQITLQQSYMLWWRSPRADSDSLPLQTVPLSVGGAAQTACVDLDSSTFTIDTYTPVSGTTQTHSHMITEDIVGNPQTDFTGGGFSGPGTIGGIYGSGLGGGSASKQVTFNQSELFMDMTDAEFKFSSSFKKPTPDVTMRPQRKVPIINPFHKTKYIIKAF